MLLTSLLPGVALAAASLAQAQTGLASATVPPIAGAAPAAPFTGIGRGGFPGDPYEKLNRGVWGFNQAIDRAVIKPTSTVYRTITPRPARRGLSAILSNLSEPWSFINNLLQGKPKRAFNNLERFIVNTTIGVGGLADHATELGIAPAPEDFGQTLATWGARDSPYLVLPLLGPSTIRDGIGTGVAFFADPYRVCLKECTGLSGTERLGITALTVISTRSDLTDGGADNFLSTSLDPYATARSAYLQRREAEIADRTDSDPAGDAAAAPESDLDPIDASSPGTAPAADAATPPAATPASPAPAAPAPVPAPPPAVPGGAAATPSGAPHLSSIFRSKDDR